MLQPVWPFQQICFILCKHTMTHIEKHTGRSCCMSPHPDPRCRPVAACLKPKPPFQGKRNSSGCMHCRQGWAHLNLSQTALVSLMAATQIRRVKGDTDMRCCQENIPQAGSTPSHFLLCYFRTENIGEFMLKTLCGGIK